MYMLSYMKKHKICLETTSPFFISNNKLQQYVIKKVVFFLYNCCSINEYFYSCVYIVLLLFVITCNYNGKLKQYLVVLFGSNFV